MRLQHTVHDGDVRPRDFVYGDVARLVSLVDGVGQEEEIATIEGGFHRAAGTPRAVFSLGVSGKGG